MTTTQNETGRSTDAAKQFNIGDKIHFTNITYKGSSIGFKDTVATIVSLGTSGNKLRVKMCNGREKWISREGVTFPGEKNNITKQIESLSEGRE